MGKGFQTKGLVELRQGLYHVKILKRRLDCQRKTKQRLKKQDRVYACKKIKEQGLLTKEHISKKNGKKYGPCPDPVEGNKGL